MCYLTIEPQVLLGCECRGPFTPGHREYREPSLVLVGIFSALDVSKTGIFRPLLLIRCPEPLYSQ